MFKTIVLIVFTVNTIGRYVNASTFDLATDRYFGLLNNFPNQSNSTLAQKLIVVDVSVGGGGATTVLNLNNEGKF